MISYYFIISDGVLMIRFDSFMIIISLNLNDCRVIGKTVNIGFVNILNIIRAYHGSLLLVFITVYYMEGSKMIIRLLW